jgi:hypothetical protein
MRGRRAMLGGIAAGCLAAAAYASPATAQTTTIGADVNHAVTNSGACSGGGVEANRPCLTLTTAFEGRPVTAPCDGTVTTFRINGFPTANTYRLRAVNRDGSRGSGGGATATATSQTVSLDIDGVNTFSASMPIKLGQYVGLDFMNSTASGVRFFFGGPSGGVQHSVYYSFPADGAPPDDLTLNEFSSYLYNADVTCTAPGDGGATTGQKCKKKKKKKGKKKSLTSAKKKKKGCKKKKKKKKK